MPPTAPLVLVVDDAQDSRDLHTTVLETAGWRVATASESLSGLRQAAELQPRAIVIDLTLPGIDGWELTRRLKADAATRDIPVIAVTGHATGEARDRALRAGVSGYLVKPCLPADLVAEVRAHAGEPGAG